jgi:hypothetical protein
MYDSPMNLVPDARVITTSKLGERLPFDCARHRKCWLPMNFMHAYAMYLKNKPIALLHYTPPSHLRRPAFTTFPIHGRSEFAANNHAIIRE